LPEAQLDRFMLNVVIGYPTAVDERAILAQTTTGHQPRCRRWRPANRIERARLLVRDIVAADNVVDYAARIVRATRPAGDEADRVPDFVKQWVRWGAGPRAGQSLLLAGKARAVLHGRPAVSLEDIRSVAPPVLRHRILDQFPGGSRRRGRGTGRLAASEHHRMNLRLNLLNLRQNPLLTPV
jgi:MoxR-like ATPase